MSTQEPFPTQPADAIPPHQLDDAEPPDRATRKGNGKFAESLYDEAINCVQSGKKDDALRLLRNAAQSNPGFSIMYKIGVALRELDRLVDAAVCWRETLRLKPDMTMAHVDLIKVLARLDRLEEAESRSREALRRIIATGLPALEAPPRRQQPVDRDAFSMFPDALRAVIRCFGAAGIEAFLTGGTLLGAIRQGDFLELDSDLDFGIDGRVTPTQLRAALADDPDFRLSRGEEDDAPEIVYRWRDKVTVDFYRFFREGTKVWCGMYNLAHLIKWVHEPFDLVDFQWHGVTVKVPADSDRFLTELYGDWRTPDPDFPLFAARNIEGGFSTLPKIVAYTQILFAICQRDRDQAIKLCDEVLALVPGNDLMRRLRHRIGALLLAHETTA